MPGLLATAGLAVLRLCAHGRAFLSAGGNGTSLLLLAVFLTGVAAVLCSYFFRRDTAQIQKQLKDAQALAAQREHERDLAQEELFRRLYQEGELNKEKMQFQAQLAEYEKYAALAQLALGAAHDITNPLLGLLSHLELELRTATDEEDRQEIEQFIQGTKRISSTLRGLVNYARPGPLVLSKISLHRLVADTLASSSTSPCCATKNYATKCLRICRTSARMRTSCRKFS